MQDQPTKAPRRTKLKGTTGVYRSISGAYEVSFRDSDGRLRFETLPKGSTLADAKALRADKVVRLQRGERVVTTRVTVDEYATETFFPALRVRERTQAIYESNYRLHIRPRLGRRKLAEVTVDDVARLIADLEREGKAAWSIRGVLTVLGRIFATAERAALIPGNPVRKLDRGERPKTDTTERRILSEVEQAKLLAEAGTFKALVAVGMFAGLRMGEALGLTWQDIDFEQGFIRVGYQLDRQRNRVELKTTRSRRSVVLMPQLAGVLREHKMASRFKAPTDFVFPAPDGRGREHRATGRGIERAVDRAQVGPLSFHGLRHGFASMLINGLKQDVETVSRQLGHASASITLDIYSHQFEQAKTHDELRNAMSASFGHLLAETSS